MTQHSLQGRRDDEVLWFQRRTFLQGAAAFTALGGFEAAWAQSRSNIVELRGDALVDRPHGGVDPGLDGVAGKEDRAQRAADRARGEATFDRIDLIGAVMMTVAGRGPAL